MEPPDRQEKGIQAGVLNLITIGEAASRIVSDHGDFAAAHSEISWAQMRGMRNRMATSTLT